jgi:2-methylisocitrate lyase-like PEP mutase family enzyme
MLDGVTVEQLANVGAKRLSIGGALARAALTPVLDAATEMLERGRFGWTSTLASSATIDALLAKLDR